MGFSINDRINIGKYSFDLQTEAKGNKIIGEIIFQGKVLRKIEKPNEDPERERELAFEVHQSLKQILMSKLQEKLKLKDKKLPDEHKLRAQLLSFLEIEEQDLKAFFFKQGNIEIFSIFDQRFKGLLIDEWVKSMEKEILHNFFFGSPHLIFLPVHWKKQKLTILFFNENKNKFKTALAVANVRFSFLRKKLYSKGNDIHKVISNFQGIKKEWQ